MTSIIDPAELVRQSKLIPGLQNAGLTDGAAVCTTCHHDVFTTAGTDQCAHVHRQAQGIEPVEPPRDPPEDPFEEAVPDHSGNDPERSMAEYKARLLSRNKSGRFLTVTEFPPLQWIVPGLIAEGAGVLVAAPKIGKSWMCLDVGLNVATGGKVLGRIRVTQRDVLYLALEDGDRRMQSRCRTVLGGDEVPSRFEYNTKVRSFREIIDTMNFWLDDHPSGLVMMDPLGKVMTPAKQGQGAYERDYEIGSRLKDVADTHEGSAVVTVHHNRKASSDDWMDATNGTQGINGAMDWTIAIQRSRNDGDAVIHVTGRDVEEGDYAASFDAGRWSLQGDDLVSAGHAAVEVASTVGLSSDMRSVVDLVNGFPGGITSGEVCAQLSTLGADTVRQYLRRAAKEERIAQPERRGPYFPKTSRI
jgi:hypothetical protein